MKHTPTPWAVFEKFGIINKAEPEGDFLVASTQTNFHPEANREADAAFIVKACNAHDKLVLAADKALSVLSDVDSIEAGEAIMLLIEALESATGRSMENDPKVSLP